MQINSQLSLNPSRRRVHSTSYLNGEITKIIEINSASKWVRIENKRIRSPEKAKPSKQTKLDSYWLNAVNNSNRFDILSANDEQINPEINEKPLKPPPIFVGGVENIQPLINLLKEIGTGNFEIKVISSDRVKVQINSAENYSTVIKALESKNTQFYTYKPKSERCFKVILKNLHPTFNIDDIKEALSEYGHSVTKI